VRAAGQFLCWILFVRRPSSSGDFLAILGLVALLGLGALALSWPWVSTEVPRAIGTGFAIVRATVATWLGQLAAMLRPG